MSSIHTRKKSAKKQLLNSKEESKVKIIKAGEIKVYELKEHEIDILEKGAPNSTYLNLAIAFISLGLPLLFNIVASNYKTDKEYYTSLMIGGISLGVGFVFVVLWRKSENPVKETIRNIKNRGIASE